MNNQIIAMAAAGAAVGFLTGEMKLKDGMTAAMLGALGPFRTPAKFMFLASLGLALLAGRGLDRALAGRARSWTMAPGVALIALSLALWAAPDRASAAPTTH
jgi:hypothetical protein